MEAFVKMVLGIIGVIVIIIGIGYFKWWVSREINYKLQYESMVQDTVRSMVKQEALK